MHLDLLEHTHPIIVRDLCEEVASLFNQSKLHPIKANVFEATNVVSAFRLMSSGKHHGKIIIEFPQSFRPQEISAHPQTLFPHDKSVLVTGGVRGIGLEIASWAASRGAQHIILVGSSGKMPYESELRIKDLKEEYPLIDIVTLCFLVILKEFSSAFFFVIYLYTPTCRAVVFLSVFI